MDLWVYSARPKVPSWTWIRRKYYALDKFKLLATRQMPRIYTEYILHYYRTTNYYQHAKCLHHGPHIYAEYIFHCYRTSNNWQLAKMPARPFYTCFLFSLWWPVQRLALNSSFIKLQIKNPTASSFFSFILLQIEWGGNVTLFIAKRPTHR